MLAATVIFTILVALMMTAVSAMSTSLDQALAQKSRAEAARRSFELMSGDLQRAVDRRKFDGKVRENSFCLNRYEGEDAGYGMFWEIAKPGVRSKNDVHSVGYLVVKEGDGSALYRRLLTKNRIAIEPEIGPFAEVIWRDLESPDKPTERVADGVLAMYVTLLDKAGQEVSAGNDTVRTFMPGSVRVELVIADPSALRRQPGVIPSAKAAKDAAHYLEALPKAIRRSTRIYQSQFDLPSSR